MPVGLQIKHLTSGPPARCGHTSLTQAAFTACYRLAPSCRPIHFSGGNARRTTGRAPGLAGRPGFVSRSRASGIAQQPSCTQLSRRFQVSWRMPVGIHWQPADSNSARSVARPGENSHQPLSPCCVDFCDECRWNYILKEDEVVGSSPTDSNRRDRSSAVERVNTFHQFCRHSLSRRMPE